MTQMMNQRPRSKRNLQRNYHHKSKRILKIKNQNLKNNKTKISNKSKRVRKRMMIKVKARNIKSKVRKVKAKVRKIKELLRKIKKAARKILPKLLLRKKNRIKFNKKIKNRLIRRLKIIKIPQILLLLKMQNKL